MMLLTMNIEMKPRSILMGVRRPVEEDNLALVPALVGFSDVGQVETRVTIG